MIKYETIISNFDDKTTLYNWLRKVEEALKHASATNFVVNKKGNATLSFSITFADGTTLESGDIVLQQGESVDGARIASGVLQLHLTNGTWLTAGNIKPVSNFNIDASQHLIVNYQDGTSQDLGPIFNGNVNIAGTLNATKVTGDEIVETMSGYTWTINPNISSANIDMVYVGVCKNGNKITFALFGRITNISADDLYLGSFTIPNSVLQKLYTYQVGNVAVLAQQSLQFFKTSNVSILPANAIFEITKSAYAVIINLRKLSVLDVGTEYTFRIEQTFLLNDNLAQ